MMSGAWREIQILNQILGVNTEDTVSYLHNLMYRLTIYGPRLGLSAGMNRSQWEIQFKTLVGLDDDPKEISAALAAKVENQNKEGNWID